MRPRGVYFQVILWALLLALSILSSPACAEQAGGPSIRPPEITADEAVERLRKAIKEDPRSADKYEQLGYLLVEKGHYDEAITSFDAALNLNPRLRTSKTGKGLALVKKGDAKGAEVVLKDALQLNPDPAMTHYVLGLVYESLNDYGKAAEHFKEGLKKYKSGKR